MVARAFRLGADAHQAAEGVAAVAGRDALREDGALGVAAHVDHLGAGVGLLAVLVERHRKWKSPTESSPRRITLGYFQVIAEPVSTWVQEMCERAPRSRRAW